GLQPSQDVAFAVFGGQNLRIPQRLNRAVLRLQSALEESQLNKKQLKRKLEVQTETLNNKMEELRALNEHTQSSMTSEVTEVQMKIMELETLKVELQKTRQECWDREQLDLTNSKLQRHLERSKEEKEEREKEAVSCFNSLEKAREANRDLQVQLEQILQQAQDPNSKGNSLFAELEDKRAEMARQLISMKVQNVSLQKQHAFSKQQLQRMKVQIAALMQLQGSRADPAQLERLQSMLSDKNEEIQNLTTKLQRLEKMEIVLKSANSATAESGDGQDETYYTDLLEMKLNDNLKHAELLADELSLQRMKSLSESQRALALERKLFSSEQRLKQTQSDKIKLHLRVEELQHKYEPKEAKKNLTQKRKGEKLPFDIIPSSEETTLDKGERVVAMEMDVTNTKTADPEADCCCTAETVSSTQLHIAEPEPQPAKCVKISRDEPAEIPNPTSSVTDCKEEEEQQQNKRERRKKETVEVIHVSSNSSMENDCAQQ
ncbi:protein Spindly, partial [Cottoperca gobio]|uniref:Protein Spindly n=1 Tax=Cottoperca gobio TaxID=56716 RepID=A0A6J2QF17_COTGO